MADLLAHVVHRAGQWTGAASDRLALDYEGRFLRRKRLLTEAGMAVVVDLAQTVSLDQGDALEAADGSLIEVAAAPEPLLRVEGDLLRLAWHIGNRHTPCQVAGDHLLIRDDHVLADMLARLGAAVTRIEAPFRPEGGAYGHGRTHGHSHGPSDGVSDGVSNGHSHGHDDGHSHSDSPSHTHGHIPGHSHGHKPGAAAQAGPGRDAPGDPGQVP